MNLLLSAPHSDAATAVFHRGRTCRRDVRLLCFAVFLAAVSISSHQETLQAQVAQPSQQDAALQQADAALRAGNIALAEQRYQEVLRLDPHNGPALAELGTIAYSRRDCGSAIRDLRAALQDSPQMTQARALLGICEKQQNDASALADLQSAFKELPEGKLRIEVGVNLADMFYQRGDIDATLPVLQKLLTLAPDNTDILFFAQRIYSEQADNALNKLLLLAPDSARMQQLIAEKLINSGDARDAIDHYKKALALDPHLPGMHFELAEAYMQQGSGLAIWQLAREQLQLAREADGDNPQIECALGSLDQKQGNEASALTHFQRAYRLAPSDPEVQLDLGKLLADQNQPNLALPLLRAAVAADPMNAGAHYRLARVCHQLHLSSEESLQLKLYREIRQAQDKVAAIHQQMNRQPDPSVPAKDEPK